MYQNDPQKVLTKEIRISYSHLTAPYASPTQPNAIPKYSAALLIPKSDTAMVEDIRSSIRAAAQAAMAKVWGGIMLPDVSLFSIMHDGDGVNNSGKPYGPEAKGCWVINAASQQKPQVVHISNVSAELAPQDVYSGMYARVTMRFYGTNKGGNKMCCGLGNVMKTRDGEPLGSGSASAADDFAGLEDSAAGFATQGAPSAVQINPLTGLPM